MKMSEDMTKYRCDACKHQFLGKEVKLKPAATNIDIFKKSIYVVDKDGNIQRTTTDKLQETDNVLMCPKCDTLHLFGLDVVGKKQRKGEEIMTADWREEYVNGPQNKGEEYVPTCAKCGTKMVNRAVDKTGYCPNVKCEAHRVIMYVG